MPDNPFCHVHHNRLTSARRTSAGFTVEDFLRLIAEPSLPAYSLPLIVLSDPLRTELLFAMQTFDAERELQWDAANWRKVFTRLREVGVASVIDRTLDEWLANTPDSDSTRHLWRHLVPRLVAEHNRFTGAEANPDVLDPFELGLTYNAKRPNKQLRDRQAPIDLGVIDQAWLREPVKHWIIITRPYMEEVRRAENLFRLVSEHLAARHPTSDDPTTLTAGTMTDIVALVNAKWTKRKTQDNYFAVWWKVIDHARSHGLWNEVPDAFKRDSRNHKSTGVVSYDPDDEGSALPEAVVRHLTRNLRKVGSNMDRGIRGGVTADVRDARYETMLTILRDTGRRPGEIVSLSDDCVRLDSDGETWVLVWDNHKAKRERRRLPITGELAQVIEKWRKLRAEHGLESEWLFPSPLSPDRHISTGTLETALESWIKVTPEFVAPVTGVNGDQVRVRIGDTTLYSFRHTYAQRHADSGVDPDDLRRLMDHRSIATTMRYYRVGWKRKRAAAKVMAQYTQDRYGNTVGLSEARRGISRVAVPYGGCTEPSNVRAGGGECPIRFQCAGCDFYRPDPSHMPALEELVFDLRKNLAQASAMGSPAYTVDNFRGQIEDYEQVIARMQSTLDDLPEEERRSVEQHAAIMRRARAAQASGRSLTLIESEPAPEPGSSAPEDRGNPAPSPHAGHEGDADV